jgi:thiol-disulfide isomerase/thioredoxin
MRLALASILISLVVGGSAYAQATPPADLIRSVRSAIAAGDFAKADSLVADRRALHGVTSELIAAISWLGRGAHAAGRLDEAAQYAAEAHDLALERLATVPLADDAQLQIGLGAAIEVEALVRAARGARAEAVYFLQRELETYAGTPIHKRLQKNLHLLSLEGKTAPSLSTAESLGAPVPGLGALKGSVVLLFFWAHWCPDCKAQAPIVATLIDRYRTQGLRVVAPTQHFGYIVAGRPAPPDVEMQHIEKVRDEHYAFLRDELVPLGITNHERYGVSTTPTLVLIDREGIVRLYHPGTMTQDALDTAIRALL